MQTHDRLSRVEDKLDRITDVLAMNTASLQEHMRRTSILEEEVKLTKKSVTQINNVWLFIDSGVKLLAAVGGIAMVLRHLGII